MGVGVKRLRRIELGDTDIRQEVSEREDDTISVRGEGLGGDPVPCSPEDNLLYPLLGQFISVSPKYDLDLWFLSLVGEYFQHQSLESQSCSVFFLFTG